MKNSFNIPSVLEQPSLKVLSIDWDYFMDVTNNERSYMFPDGGNEALPGDVQDIIWATHYSNPNYNLESIQVDKVAMEKIRLVLENQKMIKAHNNTSAMMVTDSHKHIYDFIVDSMEDSYQPIEVYNVDFHHDIYPYGEPGEVNCGNWLRILSENFNVSSHWVAREDSQSEESFQKRIPRATLDDLMEVQFDIVFFCRSGMWSPPHLDDEFIRLVNYCIYEYGWDALVNKRVLTTRATKEFKQMIEIHRQTIDEVIKQGCTMSPIINPGIDTSNTNKREMEE